MQELDVTSVSIIIASASVVIGMILAILQLRDQNKTRQAQLFMGVYEQFSRSETLKWTFRTVDDFEHCEPGTKPAILENNIESFYSVMAFFEGVGVLVSKKLIDVHLVADLISGPTIRLWTSVEDYVRAERERLKRPQIWEWTEYLYSEIVKIPSRRF
ncbi:MAG: hypothetical protein ACFE8Z_06335 [Candidatus Hermodarchaeota archaeon]